MIDRDPAAFARLGSQFGGATVTGVGFDRDTLVEAGIERADAFAAVSNGDKTSSSPRTWRSWRSCVSRPAPTQRQD